MEKAQEFLCRTGFPSEEEAIAVIQGKALSNVPISTVSLHHIKKIRGKNLPFIKGRQTHLKLKGMSHEVLSQPTAERAQQKLFVDLLFLDNHPYFITKSLPLDLVMIQKVKDRSAASLSEALLAILAKYRSRGFEVKVLYSDNKGGVSAARTLLEGKGVQLDFCSASQHVPVIERTIRFLKERMRSILASLPYTLPPELMEYLAQYAVQMINSLPRRDSADRASPREQFIGRPLDYNRDFRIIFNTFNEFNILFSQLLITNIYLILFIMI